MQNRIPDGAGLFIVPADTRLEIKLTLTGPFAQQLQRWAEEGAAKWKKYPSYQRELRAEQRRLALLLLCEAIGAVAADGGFWLKDLAVNAVIAPRLDAAHGDPRRIELIEMEDAMRDAGLSFNRRQRN